MTGSGNRTKDIIVIGGGAAGFFAAINLVLMKPELRVSILEKTNKVLSKVRISGGGRCNVTHHCFNNAELVKSYPRGHRELLQVFARFSVEDTISWFSRMGIRLKTEEDGRMFPASNSSLTIIDCFMDQCQKLGIGVETNTEVFSVKRTAGGFLLNTARGEMSCAYLVCAAGGHQKEGAYSLIRNLGHRIEKPLPSLFTLNMPGEDIRKDLQGLSVPSASVKLPHSKKAYEGPLLVTHWGLSGPAVLKLSAYAATELAACEYRTPVMVNWTAPLTETEVTAILKNLQKDRPKALPASFPVAALPRRLWEFLLRRAAVPEGRPWAEIGNKNIQRLASEICNTRLVADGKTTFKEEFVTCGGVNLKEVDFRTMESRIVPGLYFCGEVLNIDGITGGFNFQAAWSTAWLAAFAITARDGDIAHQDQP